MQMTFTPTAMSNATATLVITETGLTNPIKIPLQGAGGNPIPNVISLSPPGLYVNSPSTTIAINGSGFVSSTLAYLQNSSTPLPTTFVSSTQINVQIPDTALANIGQVYMYVVNPAPAGGSAYLTLPVIALVPTVGNITPTSIVAGTASEPIIINGQNFMSGATVKWNGRSVATTYLSPTQLQAQPTTGELAAAGLIQLTVTNPPPGTISPPFNFDVTYPITVTILDLPANDLVWDPFAEVLYASLPSTYGVNGNSIAVINPTTGAVMAYHFAGSEPDKLAIDANSKYLYVGLNGNGSIQRLNLPGFTPDIQITLGDSPFGGPNLAGAIAVSPATAHTIAVALANSGCCGSGPLEFFTDSTQLANSVSFPSIQELAFANGTTLYGYESNTLSQVTVSSSGGTLAQEWNNIVTGNSFEFSGGLVLGGNGEEFNPSTGSLLGTFDVGTGGCCSSGVQMLPNSSLNRVFALGITPFFNSFGITSYNLTQFTPLAVASLAELSGSFNTPSVPKFIPWGTKGLAFIVTSGCCGSTTSQVVLVKSPSMMLTVTNTNSPQPVANSTSPSSVTHGTGNFRMAVRGSGFVPGSVVTWNGTVRSASYVSSQQMTVYVPKTVVASPGTANIVVKNPTPGGGKSNTLTFTIK